MARTWVSPCRAACGSLAIVLSLPGAALARAGLWQSSGPVGTLSVGIATLAIDPTGTLYAGSYGGGLFKSSDSGSRWFNTSAGLTDTVVQVVAIDSATPTTLFAATSAGVSKSVDAGATWTSVLAVAFMNPLMALALDAATPGTLYAGSYGGGV
jgi:hypothetical protein